MFYDDNLNVTIVIFAIKKKRNKSEKIKWNDGSKEKGNTSLKIIIFN